MSDFRYSNEPVAKVFIEWSQEWKSWGIVPCDAIGNQTQEALWVTHKKEALQSARILFPDSEIIPGKRNP